MIRIEDLKELDISKIIMVAFFDVPDDETLDIIAAEYPDYEPVLYTAKGKRHLLLLEQIPLLDKRK